MECDCSVTRKRRTRIFRAVTHCIFELDGLLLDTEDNYENIVRDIVNIYGKDLTWAVRSRLFGRTDFDAAEILVKELKLPISVHEYLEHFTHRAMKRLRNSKLIPGAERLITHFSRNRIPMALTTSSTADMVRIKTESHRELLRLMHHKIYGGSDEKVSDGKPAPDIFFIAAQRFIPWVAPMDCLVFEHSPIGVQAARTAKMQCVMMPDIRFPPDQMRAIANEVIYTLEDFRPELYGLPPFSVP